MGIGRQRRGERVREIGFAIDIGRMGPATGPSWAKPNEPLKRLVSQLELGLFGLRAEEEARFGSKIHEPEPEPEPEPSRAKTSSSRLTSLKLFFQP